MSPVSRIDAQRARQGIVRQAGSCQDSYDYLLANRRPLLIGRAVLREVVANWKAEVKI
jgi:hypothetical protein